MAKNPKTTKPDRPRGTVRMVRTPPGAADMTPDQRKQAARAMARKIVRGS